MRLANDVTALFSAVAALLANKSLILRIKQFGVALSMVQLSKGRECAARSNFGRRRRMLHHRLGYEYLRGLAINFASTHQTENPQGFSEVSENKQLLIAIVVSSYFIISVSNFFSTTLPFFSCT